MLIGRLHPLHLVVHDDELFACGLVVAYALMLGWLVIPPLLLACLGMPPLPSAAASVMVFIFNFVNCYCRTHPC